MTTQEKVRTIKNFYCRDEYWQIINRSYNDQVFKSIQGATLRKCKFGEKCKGAHHESEIQIMSHNHNFNNLDKSKLDLISIYNDICDIFKKSKESVLHPEFKEELENYKKLDFVELLNFWFKITCYHRKAKKEYRNGTDNNYYKQSDNIPQFFLKDEDLAWSLERITKLCPKHNELIRKINYDKDKPILWDMCCGSINCKEGCHNISHMICKDNLINGKCECISLSEFSDKQSDLKLSISNIKEIIDGSDENGFIKNLTSKKKKGLESKILKLNEELNNIKRKIHLTEQGLVPFVKQKENYQKLVKKATETIKLNDKQLEYENSQRIDTLKTCIVKKKVRKPVF